MRRTKAVAALIDGDLVGCSVTVAAMLGCGRGKANRAILTQSKIRTMDWLVHLNMSNLAAPDIGDVRIRRLIIGADGNAVVYGSAYLPSTPS